MDNRKFNEIPRILQREHGRIPKGGEEPYTMLFFTMEGNALKMHRRHFNTSDYDMIQAILMAMHMVNGRIRGEMPDLSRFETPENVILRDALLMAFDPFTNPEIQPVLESVDVKLDDAESLKAFYHSPIMVLIRLLESVKTWNERGGTMGYFTFIESSIGSHVPYDTKLDFTIMQS